MTNNESCTDTSARPQLVSRARNGGITLVIGAGVSVSRGIPDWDSLAQLLWAEAFPKRRSPWETRDSAHSPTTVPQFLPIIFELAYRKMGESKFLDALQKNLYSAAKFPGDDKRFKRSTESLAVLARLLLQEFERGRNRRIDAVITLNADDLIEQAVNAVAGLERQPPIEDRLVRSVARGTHGHMSKAWERKSYIPIYHIHGFVPANHTKRYSGFYDHMLVFTDAQYWSTSATASTFANRVTVSALSESRCIFVGLSMTDINLLRWLALRTIERDRDIEAILNGLKLRARMKEVNRRSLEQSLWIRHFWIRPSSVDPTGFVSDFLKLRGVESVTIGSWAGPDFQELINECFPAKA